MQVRFQIFKKLQFFAQEKYWLFPFFEQCYLPPSSFFDYFDKKSSLRGFHPTDVKLY